MTRTMMATYRRRTQYTIAAPPQALPAPCSQQDQEAMVQERVAAVLHSAAAVAIPYVAASVSLAARVLSGQRPLTSVVVAVTLWSVMLLSELHLMSLFAFAMLAFAALFAVLAACMRSQRTIDRLVELWLRFLACLLLAGNRASLLLALGGAAAVMAWAPLPLVVRTSCATFCGFAILLWRVGPSHHTALS